MTRSEPRVRLENVSKAYRIYPSQIAKMKEGLSLGKVRGGRDFWALRDINLEVQPGTAMGVLGRNGAGKSTLLQVISGVLPVTTGSVHTRGTLVLLQLGAGFNKEFTGRENVMLNGLILGIDRRKMLERMDDIEEFADLGDFMDQPIKTYSSGMRSKLGFAVAVNVEPDILIVDESLSVGDAVFKRMGLEKMYELRDRGTTILFVSHSASMVRNFCSEAALLHRGRLLAYGDINETLDRYEAMTADRKAKRGGYDSSGDPETTDETADETTDETRPEASSDTPPANVEGAPAVKTTVQKAAIPGGKEPAFGKAKISSVTVLDRDMAPAKRFRAGSEAVVRVRVSYEEAVESARLAVRLTDDGGEEAYEAKVVLEDSNSLYGGEEVEVDFRFDANLPSGRYSIGAAITPPDDRSSTIDRVRNEAVLRVSRPNASHVPDTEMSPARVEVRLVDASRSGVSPEGRGRASA